MILLHLFPRRLREWTDINPIITVTVDWRAWSIGTEVGIRFATPPDRKLDWAGGLVAIGPLVVALRIWHYRNRF